MADDAEKKLQDAIDYHTEELYAREEMGVRKDIEELRKRLGPDISNELKMKLSNVVEWAELVLGIEDIKSNSDSAYKMWYLTTKRGQVQIYSTKGTLPGAVFFAKFK
jgi:hypothetical protein